MTQADPTSEATTATLRPMSERFRGFLPVVVDVETGGFDWNRHALLEIAAIPIELDDGGRFIPGEVACAHLQPAPGTRRPSASSSIGIAASSSSACRFQSKPPVSASTTTGR